VFLCFYPILRFANISAFPLFSVSSPLVFELALRPPLVLFSSIVLLSPAHNPMSPLILVIGSLGFPYTVNFFCIFSLPTQRRSHAFFFSFRSPRSLVVPTFFCSALSRCELCTVSIGFLSSFSFSPFFSVVFSSLVLPTSPPFTHTSWRAVL